MVPLKDRLRFLRDNKGLSQIQVADELNMKSGTYSSYENGVVPKTEVLAILAKYYDVSMDYLLGITNERKPMGGALALAFAGLAQAAGDSSPTATEMTVLIESAIKYYKAGAPCGDIPLIAMRSFMEGLRSALDAAARRSVPELIDGANATAIASLEACHMVSAFYVSGDQKNDLVLLPVAARAKRSMKRLTQIKPDPTLDKELRSRESDPVD